MTAHLSRRSLPRAVPALAMPVTLTAPLPAMAAAAESPITELYRQWAPLHAAMIADDTSDERMDALYPATRALEQRIDAEPVTCLEDLAAKVLAGATDEDEGGAAVTARVMADCRALLDARPPPAPIRLPMPLPAERNFSTMEGRISAVCAWFGLKPPALISGESKGSLVIEACVSLRAPPHSRADSRDFDSP